MNTNSYPQSRRFGLRLVSSARALLTVSALAALAVSTARADVVFTRPTTTGEHWAYYTATFTPAQSGNYTLGFNLTAGGPSGDNSIIIDAVQVTNGATIVFADGFETPGLSPNVGVSAEGGTATFGNWVCSNYSGILNGSPPNWGLAGPASIGGGSGLFTLGSADGTNQYAYLQAVAGTLGKIKAVNTLALVAGQTYTVSFYQASRYDFGGTTTYTVTLDLPSTADTTPPVINSVAPSTATLWPPNHQMVPISVTVNATDNVGVTSKKITAVSSSEPDNGLGDGDTAGDVKITGDLTVNLRAERSGKGNGRTYTIYVEVKDAGGNATPGSCTVSVPKSQGGK